jgi:hypothetical protein
MESGLDAVYYEIQQLLVSAVLVASHPGVNNAVIESRLLHVRTLIDFFEVNTSVQDDILAAHYGFRTALLPIDEVYRQRLNKDLAHLTYSRTKRTADDKPWPHARVVLPVLERCQDFIDHVLTSRTKWRDHGPAEWESLRTDLRKVTAL